MRTVVKVLSRIASHPLSKGHKTKAIWRFISWQLRARMRGRPLTNDWIGGTKLVAGIGESGLTGNIYTGLLEFPEMGFLLHVLRPSDVFVDVGANAGIYTILASGVVASRTIAFEPVPGTFERLGTNIRVNGLERLVTSHNLGLSNKSGILRFSTGQDSMNRVVDSSDHDSVSVPVEVTTLDAAVSDTVFMIKIDVEGYEYPILKGASRHLSSPNLHAVILELNGSGREYGYRDEQIVELMFEYGFLPFEYDPFSRKLTALDSKSFASQNTIFIRSQSEIEERLQSADKIEVYGQCF